MENPSQTKMRHNPEHAQMITKQNTAGPASVHFTTQTDYLGPCDWQEELYQMIKRLKNQYLPELSNLYNKLSMKLQHIDNHMPAQKLTENYEKMKNFKLMLERTTHFVQIDKSCVQLAHKDKIPVYEKQILAIINSQKRQPVQTVQQSAGQSPSCSTSRFPVDSTAQTDYSGAADWQEELYQMIKTLKDQYLPELSDLYNKICMKLQHIDNHMPAQKLTEHYEKMKNFKFMLDRTMQFLQIHKSCVQLAHKERIPVYEKQIVALINSQKRKPVQTVQQSAGQSPSCNTNRILVHSTAQTDYSDAGDPQEELYQLNRALQNQYVAGLNDLYEISMKLHDHSHMPPQRPLDQYEKMDNFKLILERSLHSLQIGKRRAHPALEENIPIHKRQITNILNSEGWKFGRMLEQSFGQTPNNNFSRELSPERSKVQRIRPYLKDDVHG